MTLASELSPRIELLSESYVAPTHIWRESFKINLLDFTARSHCHLIPLGGQIIETVSFYNVVARRNVNYRSITAPQNGPPIRLSFLGKHFSLG